MNNSNLQSIMCGGRKISYEYRHVSEDAPLMIVLHGHNKNPRPSKLRSDECNILCPVDTFGLNGYGSWFLGEKGDFFWLEAMKSLISRFATGNELFFVGSSMGGYGAILHGILNNASGVYANIPQTRLIGSRYETQGMRAYFNNIFGDNIFRDFNDLREILPQKSSTYFDITALRWDKDDYLLEQILDFSRCLVEKEISFSLEIINDIGHGLVIPLHQGASRLVLRSRQNKEKSDRSSVNEIAVADNSFQVQENFVVASGVKQHQDTLELPHEASPYPVERKNKVLNGGLSYIDPSDHGISGKARVCILDRKERRYKALVTLAANEVLAFNISHCNPHTVYRIDRIEDDRWTPTSEFLPFFPKEFKADLNFMTYQASCGSQFSIRNDVVIGPYIHLNGNSIPIGVRSVYQDGKFVPEALRFALGKQMDLAGEMPCYDLVYEDTVIFADLQNSGFGHFLTEGVSRLWYAKQNPSLPVVWLGQNKLSSVQRSIVDLLDIKNEQLFIEKPTMFRKVIFPFPGIVLGDFLSKAHAQFLGVFDKNSTCRVVSEYAGARIFLSRAALSGSRGKSKLDLFLEETMRSSGYIVVYPEMHDLHSQLAMISAAEIVCGVEGSALHLPLLIKDQINTKFIAIARHRNGNGIFEQTRVIKNLNYKTFDFSSNRNTRKSAHDTLDIDPDLFVRAVKVTDGFSRNFDAIEEFLCSPVLRSVEYQELLKLARVKSFDHELPVIRRLSV